MADGCVEFFAGPIGFLVGRGVEHSPSQGNGEVASLKEPPTRNPDGPFFVGGDVGELRGGGVKCQNEFI